MATLTLIYTYIMSNQQNQVFPANETSVLLFSSKSEEVVNVDSELNNECSGEGVKSESVIPQKLIENKQPAIQQQSNKPSVDMRKVSISSSSPGEQKTNAPFKIIIETRDVPIKTTIDQLLKFNVAKDPESYLRGGEPIWLDFRSQEVHDFLDVIDGRKQHLRNAEHVQCIAKKLNVDFKLLDEEYNRLADLIKESIIMKNYTLFPAGKITTYNKGLILIKHANSPIISNDVRGAPLSPLPLPRCEFPGIGLKNAISKEIRKQFDEYAKCVQEYIWKRVNGSIIHLKGKNNSIVPIRLITTDNFSEYWLFYTPMVS